LNLQTDIKEEKIAKTSTIESQLAATDEKLTDWEQLEQKRNVVLKSRLSMFLKYIEEDHI